MNDIQTKLKERLENNEFIDLPYISHFLDYANPFDELGTEYLQNKFFRQHFGRVVSQLIIHVYKLTLL